MSISVYETDIGTYLNKNGNFSKLDFKIGDYPLKVKLGDVSALKGNNMHLLQQVQNKCWPAVQKRLPKLITDLKKADEKADEAKRDKSAQKAMDGFLDDISEEVISLCQGVFDAFAKDRKDYRVYKIKRGVGITVSGVGLAGSIALTAASGWSGVGTVVGAVGIVRSAASLVQQVANLTRDSEQIYDRIIANVLKLRKQLASPNIKENTAKQVASTVLNKVFAVEIESLVVTVEGIESDFELLLNKVKGNKVNVVSLANDIPKLMKEQDKVTAEVDALKAIGVRTGKEESKLKKLEANAADVEKRLDTLLKQITGLSETITKLEKYAVQFHHEISTLNSKFSGKAVKAAGIATELVFAATTFVAGNFTAPSDTIADLHRSSKALITGFAMAKDGLDTVYDSGSAIYQAIKKG